MRKVRVRPWDESYQVAFGEEAMRLKKTFGSETRGIFHIGSTSVPGLKAKPIIDILVVVRNIEKIDNYNDEMEVMGYEALGEHGIPGRRYFQRGEEDHTHHVHIFEEGNQEIERHIAFRDYLRSHPKVAEEYGNLKSHLAEKHPEDIDAYQDGKDAMIESIQSDAVRWYREYSRSKSVQ